MADTKRIVQIPVPAFVPHRWMLDVLRDPHRFKVLRWHRRARKTTLGLNQLIRACCATQNETYAYVAPTYKQAKAIVVRDPLMLKRFLPPEVLAKPFNESELYAQFRTGSVLRILGADEPDSLRGPRLKGVVLDEWALQKREIFEEILAPVLRESDGWAQFQFTPKGRNHAWEYWRRGQLPDHHEWASFDLPADQSGLLTPEELALARMEMGEDLYRQEMLCEFLEDVQAVFRVLDQCLSGSLEASVRGRRYVMGVDLGRVHDATVLTVLDCATRHLVAYERLTESHWALQKQAIAALATRYDALVVCEDNSFGSPIVEDLQELGLSVEGFTTGPTSKRALIDGLRVAFAQRLVTIPRDQTQLIQELRDYEYKLPKDGTFNPEAIRYGAPDGEGFYDDSVISLALAVYGLKGEIFVSRIDVQSYGLAAEELPVNHGLSFSPAGR